MRRREEREEIGEKSNLSRTRNSINRAKEPLQSRVHLIERNADAREDSLGAVLQNATEVLVLKVTAKRLVVKHNAARLFEIRAILA